MTVASLSEDGEKYKDKIGTYNLIPGETYNGRPVWSQEKMSLYLFHFGMK